MNATAVGPSPSSTTAHVDDGGAAVASAASAGANGRSATVPARHPTHVIVRASRCARRRFCDVAPAA
ncbi:Uncharacterised protein [Mycobacteroides abscessus]|nr:Uncharacterised protein [Mycobacteroides abscessus]